MVKNKGLLISLGVRWPELESTVSRGQDILSPNNSAVRLENAAASADVAALAQNCRACFRKYDHSWRQDCHISGGSD